MAAFSTRFSPRRMVVGLLLGGALAGFTGCVSTAEYKSLQANLQEAQRQIAEMQNDILNYRKRISELEAQLADKDALLQKGLGGVEALKRERDLLAARVKELEDRLASVPSGVPVLSTPLNNLLRDLAAMYPDLLEFDEKLGMIRFKSDMTFDLGSTAVKSRAREALGKLAAILNRPEIAHNEIRVVGHTDDVPIRGRADNGLSPNNWYLSTNRAHSVLGVLREFGVAEARGEAAGRGEQRPIAPNAPGRKGNEQNRRVEVYILPTTVPDGLTISTPGAPGATPARPARRPAATGPAAPVGAPADFPR